MFFNYCQIIQCSQKTQMYVCMYVYMYIKFKKINMRSVCVLYVCVCVCTQAFMCNKATCSYFLCIHDPAYHHYCIFFISPSPLSLSLSIFLYLSISLSLFPSPKLTITKYLLPLIGVNDEY